MPLASSVYRGPAASSSFEIAGRSIRLVRPVDPDRMLDDPDVHDRNREDDYMPYWAYLWPGSRMLAEAVVERWGNVEPGDDEVLERRPSISSTAASPRTASAPTAPQCSCWTGASPPP